MGLWSYSCGRRGSSAVRVYERRGYPGLYLEWFLDGRRICRSMKTITGATLTDKATAKRIADGVARGLQAQANRMAEAVLFGSPGKTLDELLAVYHQAARALTWSEHHRKAQERFRDFWLDEFGGMDLTSITPHAVEGAVGKLKVSPETKRKHLVYLKGAYRHAVRKLKWIEAKHDLGAVDLPRPRSQSDAYTLDEVRRLIPALEELGDTPGWLGHVAWQTGRRLSALRAVRPEDVERRAGHMLITFRKDKAGQVSQGVVTGRVMELKPEYGPSEHMCHKVWIPEAERIAGIEHIPGRGWHGIKRAFATASHDMSAAAKQSGTRRETLTGIYEQDWIEPKVLLASELSDLLRL